MTDVLPDHWWCPDCGTFDGPITDGCCDVCDPFDGHTSGVQHLVVQRTPLHELIDLCREQGLALDLSLYGPDEGQHPDSDDTKSTYLGGSRITGHKGDPMDVIRAAVRARRDAAGALDEKGQADG